MASVIDVTALELKPIEVQELSSFILERVTTDPVLSSIHTVWTGVKMKEKIGFASQLGKTGVLDASCSRPNSGAGSTLTEKEWVPVAIGDTLIHCNKELNALFKAYFSKVQRYVDLFDIQGSDLEQFLSVLLTEAAMKTVWRAAWLSDANVGAAGAATAGLVNVVTNKKFYNYFDGLWAQIFDGVTAGDIDYVEISQNNEATTVAQKTLAAGYSVELFESIWAKADSRLRTDSNKQFLVSRGIFENYRSYLQGKGENFSIDYTMDGLPSLKWNGIPVVNMETIWDLQLEADFVDNTTNNAHWLPNRAVLTVPANIPIATLSEEDMDTLEVWYEKKDRSMYSAYGFTLDAKVLEEYMIVAAY